MQKIMFNDRYRLTDVVIKGQKTMTRRIEFAKELQKMIDDSDSYYYDNGYLVFATQDVDIHHVKTRYKVGEVVAVAQSYKDLGYSDFALDRDPKDVQHVRGTLKQSAGWNNKLFVRAEACKHRIRITDVRCERLQDISYADCLKEGIRPSFSESVGIGKYGYIDDRGTGLWFDTPRAAFASLIDKVSGRGTWKSNPWVVVYEFELLK